MVKSIKPNLLSSFSLSAQLSSMKCVQTVWPSHLPSTDLFSSFAKPKLCPHSPSPASGAHQSVSVNLPPPGTSSMEPGSVWPLVTGVCHCAWWPRVPPQCSLCQDLLFIRPTGIPLCRFPFCLPGHLLMGTWVASPSWRLWIKSLWTSMCK